MEVVNKKRDIPQFVESYLTEVKEMARAREMYQYGVEHNIFRNYVPKSSKGLTMLIQTSCKGTLCRYVRSEKAWKLIK